MSRAQLLPGENHRTAPGENRPEQTLETKKKIASTPTLLGDQKNEKKRGKQKGESVVV